MMKRSFAALIALLLTGLGPSLASAADPIGTWLTRDGSYRFRVYKCGPMLCVALAGSQLNLIDRHNPDPTKRGRRLIGTTLVANGVPEGPNRWAGDVYNWTDGKTYHGYIEAIDNMTMKATGCMMGRMACVVSTRLYRVN